MNQLQTENHQTCLGKVLHLNTSDWSFFTGELRKIGLSTETLCNGRCATAKSLSK